MKRTDHAHGPGNRRPPGAPGGVDLRHLAVQLRRMNVEINRLVHGLAGNDLNATDVQALAAILDTDGPMTPGRLRKHLGLTSGSVSACVERLERAGLIRRVRGGTDRRVVHLRYASAAPSTAHWYYRPLAEATAAARSRFSEAELGVALRFLAALNEELSLHRASGD
ncbi:MarR family winged helix-turn-helix transcriptional regulator [Streptomyces sp. NPDC089424]|uniref:MarR family winged helix-turn-helix transcriptional regulator n=1 Tax=Streptomyces sp. NPDC089424 TaxID=3365917 RepID=UPI0038269386